MKKYQPSNGTEGIIFIDFWCGECERDRAYRDGTGEGCEIICKTLIYNPQDDEYPSEWIYDENNMPKCTAFIPEGEEAPEVDEYTIDMFESD